MPTGLKVAAVLAWAAVAHAGCVSDARNRHLSDAFGQQGLDVACSLEAQRGWSHLDHAPRGAEEMLKAVEKKVEDARSDGRRRLEWFANANGQIALCVTWPNPNFCFTEVLNFAPKDDTWVNIDERDELADVVCTTLRDPGDVEPRIPRRVA